MVRDSTTAITIIIILLVTFVVFLVEAYAVPEDPIYITTMCAFLADGSWDCDERWVLYVFEKKDVFNECHPHATGGIHHAVLGCATYDPDAKKGYRIVLGSSGEYVKAHTGDSVLWHEIRHLQCLCDFHASPPEESRR